MRSWSPESDPTAEQVERLARDPQMRTWISVGGARWELRLERPRGHTRELHTAIDPDLATASLVAITGSRETTMPLPGTARLGELTAVELEQMLEG